MLTENKKFTIVRSGVIGQYDRNDWPFVISWSITGRCPYNCSYCYESNSPKRTIEPGFDTLVAAMPRLKVALAPISENRPLEIRLFGGEPMAHQSFLPLLGELRRHFPYARLSCLSNGYRPLSFFKKILSIDPYFKFGISVHFENINEDSLMKKLHFLTAREANISLSLQFLPTRRSQIRLLSERICRDFPKIPLSIQFLRSRESGFKELFAGYTTEDHVWAESVRQTIEPTYFIDYIDTQKKIYRRIFTFHEAFHDELSNFKGAQCVWPMQRITINENGFMMTGFCLAKQRINIFKNNDTVIKLNTSAPAICVSDFCKCRGMRDAAKFFNPKFAPLYLGGEEMFAHDKVDWQPYPASMQRNNL